MSTAARVRTDPRISRRRRAIERSRRRRAIASVTMVAAIAGLVWLAFWSPLLNVREIAVVGGRHVNASDVAAAAGLDEADNLLLVSPPNVAAKVEELPWVREAKVDRKLPGTVRVRITERRPAVVLASGADVWTLDRRGNVLTEGSAKKGLPVITGFTPSTIEAGSKVAQAEVQDALAAWRSLSPRIRAQVVAVVAPTPERITLSFTDGTQVRFGAARALRAKNQVLRALLTQMRAEGTAAAYIDVRVPANPAISARPPAAAQPTPAPSP